MLTKVMRTGLGAALSTSLLGFNMVMFAAPGQVITGDIQITVAPKAVSPPLAVKNAQRKVNMSLRDVTVRDALKAISKVAGFDLAMDESVKGNISVDLNQVSVSDALDSIKSLAQLEYSYRSGLLLVTASDSPQASGFRRQVTEVIPLKYANAGVISTLLMRTVFANVSGASGAGGAGGAAGGGSGTGGGISGQPVTPDFNSNSILVIGTPSDISIVKDYVAAVDRPRESKTWRMSQMNAYDVAAYLAASVFNEGVTIFSAGGGGGAGGGGAGGGGGGGAGGGGAGGGGAGGGSGSGSTPGSAGFTPQPQSLTTQTDSFSEGSGGSSSGSSGGSSGGGAGAGAGGGLSSSQTVRTLTRSQVTARVSDVGPILVPDGRLNTLTLLGTVQQIATAEKVIKLLDRKVPQVVLEVALVEIVKSRELIWRPRIGVSQQQFGSTFNTVDDAGAFNTPDPTNPTSNNNIVLPLQDATGAVPNFFLNDTAKLSQGFLPTLVQLSNRQRLQRRRSVYGAQLNFALQNRNVKLLANPTVITTSDNEAIVSIVDEVIRSITNTQTSGGGAATQSANLGEVGVILNILPRVGADGSITMRIKPTISSIRANYTVGSGQSAQRGTLSSKRELLLQNVLVQDGETLLMGGLTQETDANVLNKIPGLSSLPIAGAFARTADRVKAKTELVVMITPHIVDDNFKAIDYPHAISNIRPAKSGDQSLRPAERLIPTQPILKPIFPDVEPVKSIDRYSSPIGPIGSIDNTPTSVSSFQARPINTKASPGQIIKSYINPVEELPLRPSTKAEDTPTIRQAANQAVNQVVKTPQQASTITPVNPPPSSPGITHVEVSEDELDKIIHKFLGK